MMHRKKQDGQVCQGHGEGTADESGPVIAGAGDGVMRKNNFRIIFSYFSETVYSGWWKMTERISCGASVRIRLLGTWQLLVW